MLLAAPNPGSPRSSGASGQWTACPYFSTWPRFSTSGRGADWFSMSIRAERCPRRRGTRQVQRVMSRYSHLVDDLDQVGEIEPANLQAWALERISTMIPSATSSRPSKLSTPPKARSSNSIPVKEGRAGRARSPGRAQRDQVGDQLLGTVDQQRRSSGEDENGRHPVAPLEQTDRPGPRARPVTVSCRASRHRRVVPVPHHPSSQAGTDRARPPNVHSRCHRRGPGRILVGSNAVNPEPPIRLPDHSPACVYLLAVTAGGIGAQRD